MNPESESAVGPQDPQEETNVQPQAASSNETDVTNVAEDVAADAVIEPVVESLPETQPQQGEPDVVAPFEANVLEPVETVETVVVPVDAPVSDLATTEPDPKPAVDAVQAVETGAIVVDTDAVTSQDAVDAVETTETVEIVEEAEAMPQPETVGEVASVTVGEATVEVTDDDFVIKVPKRKKAAAKSEQGDKPKAPRKTARTKKAEKLPDPGDGSG